MKSIYFTIATSLSLLSCVDNGKCTDDNGTLVNNSGKDILIISYKNYYPNIPFETISKTTTILNNSNISKKTEECPPGPSADLSFEALVEGDSIVIDYGDRKKGYSDRNNVNRNPYWVEGSRNTEQDFTYTLTPEDYANAIVK